jgi:hypothetical protein
MYNAKMGGLNRMTELRKMNETYMYICISAIFVSFNLVGVWMLDRPGRVGFRSNSDVSMYTNCKLMTTTSGLSM